MMTKNEPFKPEDFGFFHRPEATFPPDLHFYELDHSDIDKSILKDWKRINIFLSKDGDFVTIWSGPLDIGIADHIYEEEYGFNLSAEQHIENYFRGYITNKQEAKVIINAIRINGFRPYYLGESYPWLK